MGQPMMRANVPAAAFIRCGLKRKIAECPGSNSLRNHPHAEPSSKRSQVVIEAALAADSNTASKLFQGDYAKAAHSITMFK